MNNSKASRRVYRPELSARTGWSSTWILALEKRGRIPRGRVDAGGKRKFWTEEEADAIVRGMTASGQVAA